MTRYRREYIKIARKLTLTDIQAGISDVDLSLDKIVYDGRMAPDTSFFMGVFSRQGLLNAVKAFGLADILQREGLDNLSIDIDTSDAHLHRLYAYSGKPSPNHKICELVVKHGPADLSATAMAHFPSTRFNYLHVEWLLLQNPYRQFTPEKPPLPGQSFPGLGLGDRLMEVLIILTRRLRLDGILNKPHYFHTAFMFCKEFFFINPANQALMVAISKDLLAQYPFFVVAWAAHFKCILNQKDNSPLEWQSDYLLLPLRKELIKYFRAKEYQREVQRLAARLHFRIDRDTLRSKMAKLNLDEYLQGY